MASDESVLAFYYPNPTWSRGDWIKNLLLFFDGIALLVPSYMREKPFAADPAIAEALQQHGLLRIFEPETFIDKTATQALADAMARVIQSGALDGLATDKTAFHTLSWSRLGAMADFGLASTMYEELHKRGLARPSEDDVSIPMHPLVRVLVLVLLSQILRSTGRQVGLDLQPATDRPEVHDALIELLGAPSMPSAGHVVSLDLETVGIDLHAVPIDEVLDFRAQHRVAFREYARDLRRFVRDLSSMEYEEQQQALRDRQEELKDRAAALNDTTRRAWKKGGSFALGLGGAFWRIHAGDLVGAAFSLGTALFGLAPEPKESDAYSYIFQARALG